MDNDRVMGIVDPIFDLKGCVHVEELLDRLDASPDLDARDKQVLRSLWDRRCYTRKEFANVLAVYDRRAPVGYWADSSDRSRDERA